MRTEPPNGGVGRLLVRKPTRWASSADEVLRRTCLRCTNEQCPDGVGMRPHGVLQGRLSTGVNRTAEAA
eukprot:7763199-Alexandrium_andersonii.AAC.1